MKKPVNAMALIAAILAIASALWMIVSLVLRNGLGMNIGSSFYHVIGPQSIPIVPTVDILIKAALITAFWIYSSKENNHIIFEIILMIFFAVILDHAINLFKNLEAVTIFRSSMQAYDSYEWTSSFISTMTLAMPLAVTLVMAACGYNIANKKPSKVRLEKPGFIILIANLAILLITISLQKCWYPLFGPRMTTRSMFPFTLFAVTLIEFGVTLLMLINSKRKGLSIATILIFVIACVGPIFISGWDGLDMFMYQPALYRLFTFTKSVGSALVLAGAGMNIARSRSAN